MTLFKRLHVDNFFFLLQMTKVQLGEMINGTPVGMRLDLELKDGGVLVKHSPDEALLVASGGGTRHCPRNVEPMTDPVAGMNCAQNQVAGAEKTNKKVSKKKGSSRGKKQQ